jgi:hypothetical protein
MYRVEVSRPLVFASKALAADGTSKSAIECSYLIVVTLSLSLKNRVMYQTARMDGAVLS